MRPSLLWLRAPRLRRAQATVELALSLVILTTLLVGGLVVGTFANDRMIASNAATAGAKTAARLADGVGLGISITNADQQIVDSAIAVARPMTFGHVHGVTIYVPGGVPKSGPPFDTSGNYNPSNVTSDAFACSGQRDTLACNPTGPQPLALDLRQSEYPDGQPIGVQIHWTYDPPNGAYSPGQPLTESALQWTSSEAAEGSGPGAVVVQPSPLPGAQSIQMANVTGDFYYKHNPNDGSFDADVTKELPVWHQNFHVINFNPDPSLPLYTNNNTNACPHPGVDNFTHPFTNIEEPPGCNRVVAQGNGYKAGGAPPLPPFDQFPVAFQATFLGQLKIARPGSLVFTIYSDDGWIFGLGHEKVTNQAPTRVAPFTLVNPPIGQLHDRGGQVYDVIACLNTGSSPAQRTFGVSFPAPGTYPFALDYTEFANQSLTLTIGTTLGVPIAPATPP